MRVGIVTNELFDPRIGRVGGFGWAARAAERELTALGAEPVFLSPEADGQAEDLVDSPLVVQKSNRVDLARRLRRARIDLLLTVDYRPNYLPVLAALPRTPAIVWVRDPRGPEEDAALATLTIPDSDHPAAGVDPIDCASMARVARAARLLRRPLLFASPAPATLTPRAAGTFGMERPVLRLLPNPVGDEPPPEAPAPDRPRVVFLGRLDPYKRPWVFVELARRFPAVDFLLLGDAYVTGPGSWRPADLPDNVRILGHVGGDDKLRLLTSASVLVNTSIHEGLPVSFVEALWCGTPVVACRDPEATVSRFGVDVGRWDGDGLAGLDAFADGLRRVLDDDALRARLGRDGRAWVRATHTPERFAAAFGELAADAGVAA